MKVLIAGTKGQAKDLVNGFFLDNYTQEVVFYDDISPSTPDILFEKFKVIHAIQEAKQYFKTVSPNFIVAVASPTKRKIITDKLLEAGGKNIRFLAPKALIYSTDTIAEEGVIIQIDSIVSPNVIIERGVLINVKCIVSSNVSIGAYTSLAPNVFVQDNVSIGENCVISTGVTICAGVTIGDNVKIWTNKVIKHDIPSNTNYI